MKIGFYFNTSHLDNLSLDKFLQGLVGISGTDSSFLRVVKGLSDRPGVEVRFFVKGEGDFSGCNHTQVEGLEAAVALAKQEDLDFLVFNLRSTKEIFDSVDAAEKMGVKLIPWSQNPIEGQMLDRLAASKNVPRIVYVEAFSRDSIRHLKAFYKIFVIPNGIEKEVYAQRPIAVPDRLSLTYLGSLVPSKGFHHVAKAWPQVLAKVPNAELQIIGNGKLYNNHAKLGPLGLADSEYEKQLTPYIGNSPDDLKRNGIKSCGLLNRNEIIEVLAQTKVACINPNTSGSLECCSVSSLEIQMCGVPIIAGKAGGNLNTVINNKTGILVKDPNVELAPAIIKLLTDDQTNLAMRTAAREYMLSKYESEVVLDMWVDLFEKVLADAKFPVPSVNKNSASLKIYVKELLRLKNKVAG